MLIYLVIVVSISVKFWPFCSYVPTLSNPFFGGGGRRGEEEGGDWRRRGLKETVILQNINVFINIFNFIDMYVEIGRVERKERGRPF